MTDCSADRAFVISKVFSPFLYKGKEKNVSTQNKKSTVKDRITVKVMKVG